MNNRIRLQNLITSRERRFPVCILIAIFALMVTSCGSGKMTGNELSGLGVTWVLEKNQFDHPQTVSAAFVFQNLGDKVITGKDWKMYFNQCTIEPSLMKQPEYGKVEYINGDFYRFIPGKDFQIAPGDSLVVQYDYQGLLLKETDGPAGVYFVLNEQTNREKIILANHFTIRPFSDYSRIYSDPDFVSTIPDATSLYKKNQDLRLLDEDQLQVILPSPVQVKKGKDKLEIDRNTRIIFQKGLENEANYIKDALEKNFGLTLQVMEGSEESGSMVLSFSDIRVNEKTEEAYHLTVSREKGVRISGGDAAGVFYGIQSLLASVPVEFYGKTNERIILPELGIEDAPRFGYRGFLLDVSRNFQSKEAVKKLIDMLALYKINILNLRLTEDEGWRLEIAGLPELTEVGSKRGHTLDDKAWLPPSFGSGPFPDAEGNTGTGYYTRDDFREIIRYAADRHIRVVPEICFPSHARAAIKSMEARYRKYMKMGDRKAAEEFRLIDPEDSSVYMSAQRYTDNIVCVATPGCYHFYETVIADIKKMYEEAGLKLTLFNTGGDEVPRGAWVGSPMSRKLLAENPELTSARQLHGVFLKKVLEILEKHDLQVSGWEEIVLNKDNEGNVTVNTAFTDKNILPLVWDNTGDNADLGYRIANAGYRVVLCNVTNLYFDLAYSTDPREPGLYWGGFQDAIDPYVLVPEDVYKSFVMDDFGRFRIADETWSGKERLLPGNQGNIAGIQAQLWTETVKGQEMMEYYLIPKLFAFAEKAWAKPAKWESEPDPEARISQIRTGWNVIANRIGQYEFQRLENMFGGVTFRIPPPGAVVKNDTLYTAAEFPGLVVRYTTDGTEPDNTSQVYTRPVKVDGEVAVRAYSLKGRGGRSVKVNLN